MEQYIPKSALVAEIERRGNICEKVALDLRTEESKDYYQGKAVAYKETLDFLDTLEVKEVDLEKEIDCWYQNNASKEFENVFYDDIEKCSKYFFELGLKAQEGE